MRQLVNRGCGKPIPRMQAPDKSWCEQQSAIVMNGGIAKVSGDSIPSVIRLNALEVLRDLIKSFVPSNALPTMISTADGIPEPVFIVVKILQGNGLGADVPLA